jgi:integrase
MPRARTGNLVFKRSSGFNARIFVDVRDESTGEVRSERRWIALETFDRDVAKRKLAKIVAGLAAGEIVADPVKREVKRAETFAEYSKDWVERRKTAGVVMARDEKKYLTKYVLPEIGPLPLDDIRPVHVRGVLYNALTQGRARETLRKIRGVMGRIFDSAWKSELVKENPVLRVDVPDEAAQDDRPRRILTDEQVLAFLNARAVAQDGKKLRKDADVRLLELKVMAVCSRVLGGMRTAELNRWDWSMFPDRVDFAELKIQRAKAKRGRTGKVQTFIVPAQMRPILRAWHEQHGSPEAGPVFPVTKGARKGEARKERGTSYAARLRRELWRVGIREHDVHHDTPTSRRVDWHSFRRAFATSLAEAGVNEQRARLLSAHGDANVHARYVQQTRAMRMIPDAAVPALDASVITRLGSAVPNHANDVSACDGNVSYIEHARQDSNLRHSASKADALSS